MIIFNNKYDLLKKHISKGEVVNTKIVKKISANRAIANVKGYNVVIKGDKLPAENERASFYIKDFNQKEQTIILKSITMPQASLLNEKLYRFISLQLKKYNLPINLKTIRIALLAYEHFGDVNKELLNKLIALLKFNNDPEFVFSIYRLNMPEKIMTQILNNFNSFFSILYGLSYDTIKHIKKNRVSDNLIDDKIKKVWYNNSENSIDVLLKSDNSEVRKKAVEWKFFNLLNYNDKNNYIRIIPLLLNSNLIPIKVYYKKAKDKESGQKIIFFRLDVPIDNNKIIYSIEVLQNNFMSIRIVSDSNEMIYQIKNEINSLQERLSKISRMPVSITIEDYNEEKNLDLDVYI